jgi:hypothetical protein
MARQLAGSCLCGKVRYRVEDAFEYAMMCHCSQCRRTTGSAFKPMGAIPVAKLALEAGPEAVLSYGKADAHDIHCAVCGSLLYSLVREGKWAHVAYGTLIDPPSLAPQEHIFAADRAPWYDIRDDLPQWAGHAGVSARLD